MRVSPRRDAGKEFKEPPFMCENGKESRLASEQLPLQVAVTAPSEPSKSAAIAKPGGDVTLLVEEEWLKQPTALNVTAATGARESYPIEAPGYWLPEEDPGKWLPDEEFAPPQGDEFQLPDDRFDVPLIYLEKADGLEVEMPQTCIAGQLLLTVHDYPSVSATSSSRSCGMRISARL